MSAGPVTDRTLLTVATATESRLAMSDPTPIPPDLASLPPEIGAPAPEPGQGPTAIILMVVGGLVSTLLLVFLVSRLEDRGARADLSALVEQRFTLLDANVGRALDSLVAVAAFFEVAGTPVRPQFAALVRPILQGQSALKALEWVPYCSADQLPALRQTVRAEGYPEFDVRELGPQGSLLPVGHRSEYFPVLYVEPMRGNERAFGFDLGSNPARFQALDTARRQGQMVATARITLVQEQGKEYGFLLFRPVYAGATSGTVSPAGSGALLPPDPATLRGYVLGVFRLGELIGQNGASSAQHPLDLYVFDQQGKPGETLLYPRESPVQSLAGLPHGVRFTHELRVGGRLWTIVAQPPGGVLRVDRTASQVAAVAGILLTFLLALLQEQNRNRTLAIERVVAARTAELLESERRLIQANHEAVQANRLKTMFLASMSHEFRTPMNAILGLLHVLGRTPLAAGQRDYVDKIASAARRLLRLIDDILDVSRIEAGKLSVEREAFRIESVLRDVLVAVAPKLRDKPVELVLDIDPTLPGHLTGDGMRLTQVLVNLADNAAKFTQTGEITLTLAWTAETEQRLRLQVELRDSGQGMAESDLRAIFLPFVQTENTHRRKHGGTGLGLAICRQLVSLMGGDIQVSSVLGEGTRFWFDIPLDIASPAPLVAREADHAAPAVLILDAHAGAARALARMVAGHGCAVALAGDAPTAASLLAQQRFDLVLATPEFAVDALTAGLDGSRRPVRVLQLQPIGASLHGGALGGRLEKPLLPSTLSALLFPGGRELATLEAVTAGDRPRSADALQDPGAGPQTAESAANPSSTGTRYPAELRELADSLRILLERGDPEAEVAARALARWAENTPYASAGADLQRKCSNFDFREALAVLDELCPPGARLES